MAITGLPGNTWNREMSDDGAFRRAPTTFRRQLGEEGLEPVADRYHLYVSYACPWAHRTLITRALKGLEHAVSVDVVDPILGNGGWTFDDRWDGATGDRVNGFGALREAYATTDDAYAGRITVPVLWDRKTHTIVNNESSEIIRMLDQQLDHLATEDVILSPEPLLPAIDAINGGVYDDVNNGVYKAGFARSQRAYDHALHRLFTRLDDLEARLADRRYLVGDVLTEADVRLFTTLVRFDAVYHGHFKCNVRRLVDYPNLWAYTRDIYQTPGVSHTVRLDHIKHHYYASHRSLNPTGIVPGGPALDLEAPHDRGGAPAFWRRGSA